MRFPRIFLPLILLASLPIFSLRADTVTLKDGEVITGTIKAETDTDVTIEYQASASITDERTILKTDIAKVDKEQPDDIAYAQLAQVQPNPQFSMGSDQYTAIITSLKNFETQYPTSKHLPDVQKLEATFEAEQQHVESGQYKYMGQWIPEAEAEKRRIQIEAQNYYSSMSQLAGGGDYIGALQTFAVIEKSYKTTRIYPSAVTLANEILANLIPQLNNDLQQDKANDIQLKQTIAVTPQPQKGELIQQNKAMQDQDAAAIAQALRSGARWVPLIPRSQVSVTTLLKAATAEASALHSVPVANMAQSNVKVDAARTALESKDYEGANTALQQAISLWAQNEDARYTLTQLKADIATPTPAPHIAASTPTPRPRPSATQTPQMVNIIAPTPTPEPSKPFLTTIPGALSILAALLVIGGIGAVVGKRKKPDDEA